MPVRSGLRNNAIFFFLLSIFVRIIDIMIRYAVVTFTQNQKIILFFISMLTVALLSLLALWVYWKDPNDTKNGGG
jgi:uncharacterized membrane protein